MPRDAGVCTQEHRSTGALALYRWQVHHLLWSILSTCLWRLLQDTFLYERIPDWLLLLMDTQFVASLCRQDLQDDACSQRGEHTAVSWCVCLVTPSSRLARSKWTRVSDAHRCCQRPSKDTHCAFLSPTSVTTERCFFYFKTMVIRNQGKGVCRPLSVHVRGILCKSRDRDKLSYNVCFGVGLVQHQGFVFMQAWGMFNLSPSPILLLLVILLFLLFFLPLLPYRVLYSPKLALN